MDEYKWYKDDFQNNSTPHSENTQNESSQTTNETSNETSNGSTGGYSYQNTNNYSQYKTEYTYSQNNNYKAPKSKKFTFAKIAAIVVGACLVSVISISGFVLLGGLTNNNKVPAPESKTLMENIKGETKQEDNKPVQNLAKEQKEQVYSTPEVVDMVGPAVVGVINKTTYNDPFAYYYGYHQDGEVEQGSGSGVIISDDGYIVTNNHVIEGATEIKVILNAGEEYTAKLIGKDSRTDLAVLKIDAKNLVYAKLGNSSDLRVGETAIAIGNPLGQEFAGTTTQGIISGLNRSITIDNKTLNLIQTDAAINPGNSGGALCNDRGEVIGINTAKISSSQYEGIGFSIPIDDAKPIIEDLISNGYVTGRPVIGIAGRAVTEQDANAYNLKVGIYVASMTADSPADMAGIKIGDIIFECEGQKVETVDDLNEIKNKHKVGDTITMKVYRQGETKDIKIVLGEEAPGAN